LPPAAAAPGRLHPAMSESGFQAALKEADRAAKKQKTCANRSADAVSTLQQHLQSLRQQVSVLLASLIVPDHV